MHFLQKMHVNADSWNYFKSIAGKAEIKGLKNVEAQMHWTAEQSGVKPLTLQFPHSALPHVMYSKFCTTKHIVIDTLKGERSLIAWKVLKHTCGTMS